MNTTTHLDDFETSRAEHGPAGLHNLLHRDLLRVGLDEESAHSLPSAEARLDLPQQLRLTPQVDAPHAETMHANGYTELAARSLNAWIGYQDSLAEGQVADLRADLRDSDVPDGIYAPGSSYTITFRTSCNANGADNYDTAIFIGRSETRSEEDQRIFDYVSDRGLGYFGVHYFEETIRIPTTTPEGIAWLIQSVDPDGKTEESNENNNEDAVAIVVSRATPDDDDAPDLMACSFSAPETIRAGELFPYSYAIANLSPDDWTPSFEWGYGVKVVLVLSTNAIADSGDRILHATYEEVLGPGGIAGVHSTSSKTLPRDIPTGDYYLGVYVERLFDEDSYANNVSPMRLVHIEGVEPSVEAVDDDVSIQEAIIMQGNVFANDSVQIGTAATVDHVAGDMSKVGVPIKLESGATVTISADGSYSIDARAVIPRLAPGAEITEVIEFRIAGANGDVHPEKMTIVLQGGVILAGDKTSESLAGTPANDRINGLAGNDTITGGAGNDSLDGGAGGDAIFGGARNDRCVGSHGSDRIWGGYGNDTIAGGAGNDLLSGGAGQDRFRFDAPLSTDTVANVDRVRDFAPADDVFLLENSVFTALPVTGPLPATAFVAEANAQAHDALDRILYDSASGVLYYDPDGSGAAAAIRFAVLDPGLSMTSSDFLVT